MLRLLFDTNVWTEIGLRGQAHVLRKGVQSGHVTVLVQPSVLLEIGRTPRPRLDTILPAITDLTWTTLPTEAYLECSEIVEAIRRHRPAWIRGFPDSSRVATLRNWWTHRIWVEARRSPEFLQLLSRHNTNSHLLEKLYEEQREWKRLLKTSNFIFRHDDAYTNAFEHPDRRLREGARNELIEAWRFEVAMIMNVDIRRGLEERASFRDSTATYFDWLDPYVNLSAVMNDPGALNDFFYHSVAASDLKRNWLRWAVKWGQLDSKPSVGNAADEQHSAYLYEADLFFSADRRFCRCLEAARRYAPEPFAQTHVVDPKTPDLAASILENAKFDC